MKHRAGATVRKKRSRRHSSKARAAKAFGRLIGIMETLRSPYGCPWDREQSHESLRPFLLEETYEVLDAIDRGQFDALAGELGDVMFQCVFHAQIAAEAGRFDIADAVDAIAAKLIRRHPHVFTSAGRPLPPGSPSRARARSAPRVVEQWERLKSRERAAEGKRTRLLGGVPRSLPSLLRAHEIGTRVAAVGFDWPQAEDVLDKIDEEARELRAAVAENQARATEELGDLLFSIANLARKLGVEPESALRHANDKFAARFDAVEDHFAQRGRSIHDASLGEMEAAWQTVKTYRARQSSTSGPRASGRQPARRRSRA